MAVRLYIKDQNDVVSVNAATMAAARTRGKSCRTTLYVKAIESIPKATESMCPLNTLNPNTACTPACRWW